MGRNPIDVDLSDKILGHYANPRNPGSFDPCETSVGTGLVGARRHGCVMRLQIKVDEAGVIEDARFKTYGCPSAIACCSWLTVRIIGRHLDAAETIAGMEIAGELELAPAKRHCALLAEDALKAAVLDYRGGDLHPKRG